MQSQFTNTEGIAILNWLKATNLLTAKIKYYVNPAVLNPGNVVGDFTEASYPGYTAATFTAVGAYINTNGQAELEASGIIQPSSAPTVPQTVYGWYVTDSTGTNVLFAAAFPVPVLVSNPLIGQPWVGLIQLGLQS